MTGVYLSMPSFDEQKQEIEEANNKNEELNDRVRNLEEERNSLQEKFDKFQESNIGIEAERNELAGEKEKLLERLKNANTENDNRARNKINSRANHNPLAHR